MVINNSLFSSVAREEKSFIEAFEKIYCNTFATREGTEKRRRDVSDNNSLLVEKFVAIEEKSVIKALENTRRKNLLQHGKKHGGKKKEKRRRRGEGNM